MFLSHERKVKIPSCFSDCHKPTGTVTSGSWDTAFPERVRLYAQLATHERGTSSHINSMGSLQTPWPSSSVLSAISLPFLWCLWYANDTSRISQQLSPPVASFPNKANRKCLSQRHFKIIEMLTYICNRNCVQPCVYKSQRRHKLRKHVSVF